MDSLNAIHETAYHQADDITSDNGANYAAASVIEAGNNAAYIIAKDIGTDNIKSDYIAAANDIATDDDIGTVYITSDDIGDHVAVEDIRAVGTTSDEVQTEMVDILLVASDDSGITDEFCNSIVDGLLEPLSEVDSTSLQDVLQVLPLTYVVVHSQQMAAEMTQLSDTQTVDADQDSLLSILFLILSYFFVPVTALIQLILSEECNTHSRVMSWQHE